MSYNGIGLQTPRGSGTSGYVQKSLSGPKREGLRQKRERQAQEDRIRESEAKKRLVRQAAGGEILDHDRKRLIELKCMDLRDKLEDEDVEDEEVEKRVAELRRKLTKERDGENGDGLEENSLVKEAGEDSLEINSRTQTENLERSEKSEKLEKSDKEESKKQETGKEILNNPKTEKPKPEADYQSKNSYSYIPRYAGR